MTAWAQPSGLEGVCGRWQAPASGWQPAAASQRAIAHAWIQSESELAELAPELLAEFKDERQKSTSKP